jgi:hypothetical protein
MQAGGSLSTDLEAPRAHRTTSSQGAEVFQPAFIFGGHAMGVQVLIVEDDVRLASAMCRADLRALRNAANAGNARAAADLAARAAARLRRA